MIYEDADAGVMNVARMMLSTADATMMMGDSNIA